MAHDHLHNGSLSQGARSISKAFIIGISLNFGFVLIEAIAGFSINSLSVLSDAGHNLADVGTLALSLLAFQLLKVKSNKRYTYGYKKTSVLVAFFNSMVLLVSIGAIAYEAVHRFFNPETVPGMSIAIIAGVGIIINGLTALLFLRDKEKDLNIKSAYWHMVSDAIVSLGIVIGGLVIIYTNWYWIDSVLSIIVAIVILLSTWRLLRDSLRLSLDGVPVNIRLDDIKITAKKIPGVKEIHHVHIWAISTMENAMTAHLVLEQGITTDQEQIIKHKLKHELEHTNIHHITLETERENENCEAEGC